MYTVEIARCVCHCALSDLNEGDDWTMPDRDVETIRDLVPRLREDKFLSVRQDTGRAIFYFRLIIDHSVLRLPRFARNDGVLIDSSAAPSTALRAKG